MTEKKQLPGLLAGLTALLATAVFIILGFTTGRWHLLWLVFLAVPVFAIIGDMRVKKTKRGDALIGLVAILAVVVFMLLGFSLGIWYIAWVVFLSIPITAILVSITRATKQELGKREDNGTLE